MECGHPSRSSRRFIASRTQAVPALAGYFEALKDLRLRAWSDIEEKQERIMKRILLAVTVSFCFTGQLLAYDLTLRDAPVQVYFSPQAGAQEAITDCIDQAKESIEVQAYSFTSEPIAKALVRALARGLRVEVILDKSRYSDQFSQATTLRSAGIPVYIDKPAGVAHSKIIVIDDETVITGSFNFTKEAQEKNTENILIIKDKSLAARYLSNWRERQRQSQSAD